MLPHDNRNLSASTLYPKDFLPSVPIPPSYKVTQEELGEILKSPDRLEVLTLTYNKPKIDETDMTISFIPMTFHRYPHLFGSSSVLGKVFFPEEHLGKLDNCYLQKLESFLNDLNNEDNLLGEGFQESYLMLKEVSDRIKTTLGHLDAPDDGVVIWIV